MSVINNARDDAVLCSRPKENGKSLVQVRNGRRAIVLKEFLPMEIYKDSEKG